MAPLTVVHKASKTYWIVCPKATAKLPKIEIFRSWLLAEVAAVFKEVSPQCWSVSMRSRARDVARVATGFGGGGHIRAAGYTANGPIEPVVGDLVGALS